MVMISIDNPTIRHFTTVFTAIENVLHLTLLESSVDVVRRTIDIIIWQWLQSNFNCALTLSHVRLEGSFLCQIMPGLTKVEGLPSYCHSHR